MSPGPPAPAPAGGPVAAAARIRPARRADAEALRGLFALLLAHHEGLGPRFERRPAAEAEIGALVRELLDDAHTRVWLAERAGRPEGLCVASLRRRPALFRETRCGEIDQLLVQPAARRHGLGRALVREACAWLRGQGIARVQVQVAHANAEGRSFWQALGFAPSMDGLERPL